MDLHSGKRKEGKSTRCLVGSSAIGEIMARDLDARLADCRRNLLALSTGLGMEGQSGCACCWCRGAAAEFETTAKGGANLELRSLRSQLDDLDEHTANVDASKAKGNKRHPNNHNGVSAPSLFSVPFDRAIPPYLHLGLGLENDLVKEIYGHLGKLGALDPGALKKVLQEHGALFELEVCVSSSVDGLVGALGTEAAALVAALVEKLEVVNKPLVQETETATGTAAAATGAAGAAAGAACTGAAAAAVAAGGGRPAHSAEGLMRAITFERTTP